MKTTEAILHIEAFEAEMCQYLQELGYYGQNLYRMSEGTKLLIQVVATRNSVTVPHLLAQLRPHLKHRLFLQVTESIGNSTVS